MSEVKTKNVKLRTDLTIERTNTMSWGAIVIVIMGQTGVGKSTFIECLAGNKSMGISKDQLEGFTQDITIYRVVKTKNFLGFPIYLIDTPGFSDRKISEFKIVKMIQEWMKLHKRDNINRILYLDRITDIRMSGSKGRRLEMFKSLTGAPSAGYITFITTMWDNLWKDEQIARAEERFKQLKEDHWKDFVDEGAHISKFTNTRESALQILDECMRTEAHSQSGFAFEQLRMKSLRDTTYGPLVYDNLLERIAGLQQKVRFIEDDLDNDNTKLNEELISVLMEDKSEATRDLEMFQAELVDFDPPSEPSSSLPSSLDNLRQTFDRSTHRMMKNLFHRKQKEL